MPVSISSTLQKMPHPVRCAVQVHDFFYNLKTKAKTFFQLGILAPAKRKEYFFSIVCF